jgi:dTDP-4-amino-4,6-dideoxygalactose transaminase
MLVDSAAGFGATADDGQVLGRQGDVEVSSFHATKPFAIGEGGLVTTTDEEIAQRIARLTKVAGWIACRWRLRLVSSPGGAFGDRGMGPQLQHAMRVDPPGLRPTPHG